MGTICSGIRSQVHTPIYLLTVITVPFKLPDAHKSGGAGWTRERKSDKGPDEWRPPNKAFWPEYAKKYRHIKLKYDLRITSSEDKVLNQCH